MTQKPIAILGTPGWLPASYSWDTAAAFAETGQNTGNLAFQHATWLVIGDDKASFGFQFDPGEVRERCRLICVPAANFLYSGFDLGGLAARLEATGLPLMVLGLGAQAMKHVNEVRLKPGTERLLHLFAERTVRIGVRGQYTAAVLESHRISNFEILGCPSNFINHNPKLGSSILERWRGPRQHFAFAPTFYSYNARFERALYDVLKERVTAIVAQDPLNAVALARGDRGEQLAVWLNEKAGFLSDLPVEVQNCALALLRTYFSAEAWLEAYRHVDGVVGSRIHGATLGWQTGRAALVVSYDLRTEELAETMGLPMIKADKLDPAQVLGIMDELVEAKAAVYDAHRATLAERFSDLLSRHDVTVSAGLRGLLGGVQPGTAHLSQRAVTGAPRSWGFLEQYNRRRVAGWIASDNGSPPNVVIRFDDQTLGKASIKAERPDIGENAWMFEFNVPEGAAIQDRVRVEAVVETTGAHLRNSPVITSMAKGDEKKVLHGRDGWLFLQNDTNRVLDQIQGRRVLSVGELDAWKSFLHRIDEIAAGQGATALCFVAPNKECVFAEHLPEDIQLSENRPIRQLQELAIHLDLRAAQIVYPLEQMRAAGPYPAYPKGDSHWTDYGAALALDAVLGAAPLHFAHLAGSRWVEEEFQTEYRNCDLLSKLGGTCVEPQPVFRRRPAVQLTEDNGTRGTGRKLRYQSLVGAARGRLFMVHDSFGDWLIPRLAETFAETTTLWQSGVVMAGVIEKAKPTTILFEFAERFLVAPPRLA